MFLIVPMPSIELEARGGKFQMRAKAAEVGANAIILDAISEPSAGAKIAGAFLGYAPERQGKAIAIYVFPEERLNPAPTMHPIADQP